MTKAVHPIPVHSNLHHKFSFIRLVFPLEKIYILFIGTHLKHPWMVGSKGNHPEIVLLVGRK